MNIEYISFYGFVDELTVVARINDSPALAGNLVDLVRLGKIALDNGFKGTIYEVNAFYMKKPGPPNSKTTSKITAYYNMLKWIEKACKAQRGLLEIPQIRFSISE